MIKSFHIKNLATIEKIKLDLQEGFTVLTGETGTGKSIIIEGIKLVLGEKGSSDIIRTGKKETSIEAVFEIPRKKLLKDKGLEDEGNELLIQRMISGKGKGKGYIDGIVVPVIKLRSIRNDLVDIYGQNDHVFLRDTGYQLDYLDSFANAISLRADVSEAAKELRRLSREKRELEERERGREKRLDYLGFQIKEIEDAHLNPSEEDELRRERNILKNAEKLRLLTEEVLDLSYAGENSISTLLVRLQDALDKLKEYDTAFQATYESVDQFAITVQDLSSSLMRFREKHLASPEKLEKLEERLSLIEGLKRKYGNSVEEILAYLKEAHKELSELSASHERLQEIDADLKESFDRYKTLAETLTRQREESALLLEKQVEKEIAMLGMKKACFKISFDSCQIDDRALEKARDSGNEEIEFLISPNPGEDLRPLRKIASGGELSRIMLALKSIGKETETLRTLIFDEIDTGIGGKTAEAVAKKLQKLADQHQVICITHLPQIASFASYHIRIDKKVTKGRTYTIAKPLSFEERVEEIARLLTGSRITDTALKNAREMLLHNLNSPPGTQTN